MDYTIMKKIENNNQIRRTKEKLIKKARHNRGTG